MSADEADEIQSLLGRLMDEIRANASLNAEVARAEREFFHANPQALENDPSARFRFQEWYVLERESEVLGTVPVAYIEMSDEERESLSDSLVGVFRVTGGNAAEYTIEDLQDRKIHDLSRIAGVELETGDLLIGRLFDGSLDVYIASPVMSRQRDATALAKAFQKDLENLGLDRRLTQAEIEHLLFRGRGRGEPDPLPDDVPLERIEADLEACLRRGGAEGHSATAISAALREVPRPGIVTNPLLEAIAFDTDVDLEVLQRLLVQIWNHHQTHRPPAARDDAAAPRPPEPEAEEPRPSRPDERQPGLGEDIARRIQEGMEKSENVAEVFADVERMVGVKPDPSFAPESVDPSADVVDDDAPVEGDLRALITEYLWETGREGPDVAVLEQLVVTQCESSVPRLDLEAVTSVDLFRLLLQTYLSTAPGDRSAAVGQAFGALERFYAWVEETQKYELSTVIDTVRNGLVDHVARLEAAGMALSGDTASGAPARHVLRVISVTRQWIEVDPDESENLVRIETASRIGENLREGDLLLGTLQISTGRRGSFAGMVVALPAAAADLLG